MNFFKKRSLKLTEPTTCYKGQYLGNVSTTMAKGEASLAKPMGLLWANYLKTAGKHTVAMKVSVDNSGLKVFTQSQGLTHYWCHRISTFCVPKEHGKLFVWVYRHVGKRMKVELRCHAIQLSSEKKAAALAESLTEKVAVSLQEYRREKNLKQRRRLLDEKAAAFLEEHGEIKQGNRTKLLAQGKNYKPPSEIGLNSPTLTAIGEEEEQGDEEELPESRYSTIGRWTFKNKFNRSLDSSTADINMNQLTDESDLNDYSGISGFSTLPRRLSHTKAVSNCNSLARNLAAEFCSSTSLEDFLETDDSQLVGDDKTAQTLTQACDKLSAISVRSDRAHSVDCGRPSEVDLDDESSLELQAVSEIDDLVTQYDEGFGSFDNSSENSKELPISEEEKNVDTASLLSQDSATATGVDSTEDSPAADSSAEDNVSEDGSTPTAVSCNSTLGAHSSLTQDTETDRTTNQSLLVSNDCPEEFVEATSLSQQSANECRGLSSAPIPDNNTAKISESPMLTFTQKEVDSDSDSCSETITRL